MALPVVYRQYKALELAYSGHRPCLYFLMRLGAGGYLATLRLTALGAICEAKLVSHVLTLWQRQLSPAQPVMTF